MISRKTTEHEYRHLVRRFSSEYPHLKQSFSVKDIVEKIESIDACQITGRVFVTEQSKYSIIPLKPFSSDTVNANRVAVVCRSVRKQYHELVEYIIQNPELDNIEKYKESLLRFDLVNDTVKAYYLEKGRGYFFDVPDYSSLFEKYDEKTKSEILKEKIKESLKSGVVVNNLLIQNLLDRKPRNNIPVKPKSKKEIKKKKIDSIFTESAIRSKIEKFKLRSKEKGLTCNVTFENSRHLFQRKYCQLTGMLLKSHPSTKFAYPDSFSVDRINRFEGYNVANMIVLCHEANQIKGDLEKFNYTEDISKIKKILKETKARVINKYKDNSEYVFKGNKTRDIDFILKDYIEARKNNNTLQFVI